MSDTNTLYYTLSTVAQTLAGALGAIGAFVVYAVSDIDKRLVGVLNEAETRHLKDRAGASIADHIAKAEYRQAYEKAKKERAVLTAPSFVSLVTQAGALLERRGTLLYRARIAGVVSIMAMCGAVVGLCLTPVLFDSGCTTLTLIAAGLLFTASVVLLGWVVSVMWSELDLVRPD
jgi:hypothetical protein